MIPSKSDPKWRNLLQDPTQHQFKFLALKFLMMRLKLALKQDAGPANLSKCSDELHQFAVQHEKFVVADLAPIFGLKVT